MSEEQTQSEAEGATHFATDPVEVEQVATPDTGCAPWALPEWLMRSEHGLEAIHPGKADEFKRELISKVEHAMAGAPATVPLWGLRLIKQKRLPSHVCEFLTANAEMADTETIRVAADFCGRYEDWAITQKA